MNNNVKSALTTHRVLYEIAKIICIVALIIEIIGIIVGIIVLVSNRLINMIWVIFVSGIPSIIVTIIGIAIYNALINDILRLEVTMYEYYRESVKYTNSEIEELNLKLKNVNTQQQEMKSKIKNIKIAEPKIIKEEPKPAPKKDPNVGDTIVILSDLVIDGQNFKQGSEYTITQVLYGYGGWQYIIEVDERAYSLKREYFDLSDK